MRATLVLIPGLACDQALWQGLVPTLREFGPVQLSDVHTRHDNLPAMAAALLAEHPGPLILVGCSMGGMVALHAALHALHTPQRLRGLALLGSTARADTPELIELRTRACELFAAGRMDEVLRANVLFAFHPLGAARPGLVDDYLAMIRRAGAEQLIRQNRAVMARADLRPDLPRIACPTLVMCGEADGLTPPSVSREMAALIPAARLEIVPGAGHMLTLEQPARVAALLAAWLASQGIAPLPSATGAA